MFSEIVMIIEIEYLLNNGTDILIIPLMEQNLLKDIEEVKFKQIISNFI